MSALRARTNVNASVNAMACTRLARRVAISMPHPPGKKRGLLIATAVAGRASPTCTYQPIRPAPAGARTPPPASGSARHGPRRPVPT
jgi:hypothetical protein